MNSITTIFRSARKRCVLFSAENTCPGLTIALVSKGDKLTADTNKSARSGARTRHDDNVIVESSVICTYLDEVFPDQPLMPKSPAERAATRL